MAIEKTVKYKQIPKLSKVSVPITLSSEVVASTVSVVLTIPAGLSIVRGTVSAGTFDGTDTWTVGTTAADTVYTATFDFVTTAQYTTGWTVTGTLSTEPEDLETEDNIINVSILEDSDASLDLAPAIYDGLEIWDGAAAQKIKSFLVSADGDHTWVAEDLAYTFSVASTGDLSALSVALPAAIVDLIDGGDITAYGDARVSTSGVHVNPGAAVVTTGAEADDGTASSASIEFDNHAALQVSDGAAFSGTVAGTIIVKLMDSDDVAAAL